MEDICASKFREPKCTWKILGLRNSELRIRTANCLVKLVIYNQYNILLTQRHCCSNCIWRMELADGASVLSVHQSYAETIFIEVLTNVNVLNSSA